MKILTAKDEAFNFIYQANMDALAETAEVAYFSPLHDSTLPECDFLYLPGGYPELYATELSANAAMREAIRTYAMNGGRVMAECGGFMYLCSDIDGTGMCGVLPICATMQGARLHLGYRQITLGEITLKGHEFHYSSVKPAERIPDGLHELRMQRSASGQPVDTPLYLYKNVIAGYTHWYWADMTAEARSELLHTCHMMAMGNAR